MKKILITLFAFLFIVGGASASQLWEYGSFNERADKAVEIGLVGNSDEYVGNYKQNLILLDYYEPTLGVAIPKVIAWFEDTLQASISSLATSLTLVDGTDKEGNSLSGTYGLTIDEGGANEELVIATCAGTACTSITRGVSVADGETSVTALKKSHRRGASIKITNAPTLIVVQRVMNGDEGFPNRLWYDDQPTFASTTDIVTKKYADNLTNQGAATSTESVAGIVELATQIESASSTPWGSNYPHVQQSKHASSTPYSGMTGLWDIWSENDGKLSQSWIDLSDSFTWSGTHSFSETIYGGNNEMSSASTSTMDWSLANTHYLVLASNTALRFTNVKTGTSMKLMVCQDGTGSRLITNYPNTSTTTIRWGGGFEPTLTTTASKCDVITFFTTTSTDQVFGAITKNF